MAGRLRESLSTYFAKHIESGDWHSCLRVLRGREELGTPLSSLPYRTLFPLLVANGQWTSVLCLCNRFTTAGDEVAPAVVATAKAVSTSAKEEEEGLCNELLRATLAPEAVASMGSWQAAVVLVRYATHRKLRLEPDVARGTLNAIEAWRHSERSNATERGDKCRDISFVEMNERAKWLLFIQNALLGSSSLECQRAPIYGAHAHSRGVQLEPVTIQIDLILCMRDAFERSLDADSGVVAAHWLKLQEQMSSCFTSSWRDAVGTLLRVCTKQQNVLSDGKANMDGATDKPPNFGNLTSLLTLVGECFMVQPQTAERVLQMALQQMFDGSLIRAPAACVINAMKDTKAEGVGTLYSFPRSVVSLSSQCTQLRESWGTTCDVDLPKWRAVLDLILLKVELRERRLEFQCPSSLLSECGGEKLLEEDITTLIRMCVSIRLALSDGGNGTRDGSEQLLYNSDLVYAQRASRLLLVHGSLVVASVSALVCGHDAEIRNAAVELVADTSRTLMVACINGCRITDGCQSVSPTCFFPNVAEPSTNPSLERGCSVLSLVREQFWHHVLFPGSATSLSYERVGDEGYGLYVRAAWQELLREIFSEPSTLAAWFNVDDSVCNLNRENETEGLLVPPQTHSKPVYGRNASGESEKGRINECHVSADGETLRQVQEVVEFISRRFVMRPPVRAPHGCSDHSGTTRGTDASFIQRQPASLHCHSYCAVAHKGDDSSVAVAGLSKVLASQKDINTLGSLLIQTLVEKRSASVADIAATLEVLVKSIACHHTRGLLKHMLIMAEDSCLKAETKAKARLWQSCQVAVAALVHKSDVFSPSQKLRYAKNALEGVQRSGEPWVLSLAFFAQVVPSICRQDKVHEFISCSENGCGAVGGSNSKETILQYIMNVLISGTTPPRWREALCIVEATSLAGLGDWRTTRQDARAKERPPLSESEHIDLSEVLASLKRERRWISAISLFKQCESRQLSSHDIARFSFTFAHAPLSFTRCVLSSLGHQKSREIAKAALMACAKHMDYQRFGGQCVEEERGRVDGARPGSSGAAKYGDHEDVGPAPAPQLRYFVCHEVRSVMFLALQIWPQPVVEEGDFTFIWKSVVRGASGDVAIARRLLKQSLVFDSPGLRSEVAELARTFELCLRTRDVKCAIAAYDEFRRKRAGLWLPEEAMLQLLELCVIGIEEGEHAAASSGDVDLANEGILRLLSVLKECLDAHDLNDHHPWNHNARGGESLFARVCAVLFSRGRLSSLGTDRGGDDAQFGFFLCPDGSFFLNAIPPFTCSMDQGMKLHALRILQLLVEHLLNNRARFLREVPRLISVLLSITPELTIAQCRRPGGSSESASFLELIGLLVRHVEYLQKEFCNLVPAACVFWLKVLNYSTPRCVSKRASSAKPVGFFPAFSPSSVITSNNAASSGAAELLLEEVVMRALEDVYDSKEVAHPSEEAVGRTAKARVVDSELLPCAVDAIVYTLHQCYGKVPPLSAILSGAALTLQLLRAQPLSTPHSTNFSARYTSILYGLASLQAIATSFYTQHSLLQLIVAGRPGNTLGAAVEGTLARVTYKAAGHMFEYAELLSAWVVPLVRAAGTIEVYTEFESGLSISGKHINFLVQLTTLATGTCLSWPASSHKEKCVSELRRLSDALEWFVGRNREVSTADVTWGSHVLLRSIETVLSKVSVDETDIRKIFKDPVHCLPGTCVLNTTDSFQCTVLAAALLQFQSVGCEDDAVLHHIVQDLQVDTEVKTMLQKDSLSLVSAVALWLTHFGSNPSLLYRFARPLFRITQQSVAHLGDLLPHILIPGARLPLASKMLSMGLGSSESLVELIIFCVLAATRQEDEYSSIVTELDAVALIGALGATVPHRWDLALAVACSCPLFSSAPKVATNEGEGIPRHSTALRERLATAVQCCGPWPRGVVLGILLQVDYESDGAARDNKQTDYRELLEAVSGLKLHLTFRSLTFRRPRGSGLRPLYCFVQQRHQQAFQAASIILGNAQCQQDGDCRRGIFETLLSCDPSVQFVALECISRLPNERDTPLKHKQEKGSASFGPYLADFVSACLCNLVSFDVQHFIAWSSTIRDPAILQKQCRSEKDQPLIASPDSLLVTSPAVLSSMKKLCVSDAAATSTTLSFPRALFNVTWTHKINQSRAKERGLDVEGESHSASYPHYSYGTAVAALCDRHWPGGVRAEDSLLTVNCGFSCLQYVYALCDRVESIREERDLLVFVAGCCRTVEEVEQLVIKRLEGPPPLLEVVIALWNVVRVRHVEVTGYVERRLLEGVDEVSLGSKIAAPLVALAMCASVGGEGPFLLSAHNDRQEIKRQVVSEMLVHGAADCVVAMSHREEGHLDEDVFRKLCGNIVEGAVQIFRRQKHWRGRDPQVSFLDDHVHLAIRLVRNECAWLTLWPPLTLELLHCRQFMDQKVCRQSEREVTCDIRHPKAVCWLLRHCFPTSSRIVSGTLRSPDLFKLLNVLRGYVLRGTAHFSSGTLERGDVATDEVNMVPPLFVRGTAAGLVVDQFIALLMEEWSRGVPRGSGQGTTGVSDVIRHVTDALFPRAGSAREPVSETHSFLSGYTPLSTRGVVALTRLLVVREGLDKRHTAVVGHVVSLLKLERRREATRLLTLRDVMTSGFARPSSDLDVTVGTTRKPSDLRAMLLFHLRALVAAIRFVNPLGWHGERQLALDIAYTSLLEFLLLYCEKKPSLREVDVMTDEVENELKWIFGPGVRKVIQASRPTSTVTTRVGVVTAGVLLDFLCGGWRRRDRRKRRREEIHLHDELRRMLTSYSGGNQACGTPEILLLDGDEYGQEFGAPPSPLGGLLEVVQKTLWNSAVTPSHDFTLKVLDAAVSDERDITAICAAVQLFSAIAPYMVVTTMMLEKVLLLLIKAQRHSVSRAHAALCYGALDLILHRLQYVPLKTPEASAMMVELYFLCSCNDSGLSSISRDAEGILEHLLWRCVVESNRVDRAPLESALCLLDCDALHVVHRGCLLFLVQGHNRPHYDPPFLRLGRVLNTLLFERGDNSGGHVRFTEQLLSVMEGQGYASREQISHGHAVTIVPWRRSLRFIPEPCGQQGSAEMRSRFFTLIMAQLLSTRGGGSEAIHLLWKDALTAVAKFESEGVGRAADNGDLNEYRRTEVALRAVHIARPSNQWVPALKLTKRLVTASENLRECYSPSQDAALVQTARYLLEACSITSIPVPILVEFLRLLSSIGRVRWSTKMRQGISPGNLSFARVVVQITRKLQRHPHLTWVTALNILQFLNFRPLKSTNTKDGVVTNDGESEEAVVVLYEAKGDFVNVTMERMYKHQEYEQLLRFVEATQQVTDVPRINGRNALTMLKHAASVVFPVGANSTGPWEVLMLLNGTPIGKTIDDMMREQHSTTLREREKHLQYLLRNGQSSDAVVVVKQTPQLLQCPTFSDTCISMMRRFHHGDITVFYDELLHANFGADHSPCSSATCVTQYVEQLSIFSSLSVDSLVLAMNAFEVTANSARGLTERSQWTGVCIAATWLRAQAGGLINFEPFARTLLWVKRDVPVTVGGPLGVLHTTVREVLCMTEFAGTTQSEQVTCERGVYTHPLLLALSADCVASQLLAEVLSNVFPSTTSQLCSLLYGAYETQKLDSSTGEDRCEWMKFLRSTATYNAALHASNEQCRSLVASTRDKTSSNEVVLWYNREMYRASLSCGGSDWLSALAAYSCAKHYITSPCIAATQVSHLVKLMLSSESLPVVVRAARDVLSLPEANHPCGQDKVVGQMSVEVLHPLFCGLHSMKLRAVALIATGVPEGLPPVLLQTALKEFGMLNDLVKDVVEQLQQKQSVCLTVPSGALDGCVELSCRLIGCLTLIPVKTTPDTEGGVSPVSSSTSLEQWRLLVLGVLSTLPSQQRNADVLAAVMESVRHSFEVLQKLQECPIPSMTGGEAAYKMLWRDALSLVVCDDGLGRFLVAHNKMQNHVGQNTPRDLVVETLFHCAALTSDRGLEAMKTLWDSLVRPYGVSLPEEAISLLKIACIHHVGEQPESEWRTTYNSLLGEPPFAAKRHAVPPMDDDGLRELECLFDTDESASIDCTKLICLLENRRNVGVYLGMSHYRKVLLQLEKHGKGLKPIEIADVLMYLYFALLQDGGIPSMKDVEWSVRILAEACASPLLILQYAKAVTLLPCVRTKSPIKPIVSLPPTLDHEDACGAERMVPCAPSEEMLLIITEAARKLQLSARAEKCGPTNEKLEALEMLASFLRWSTQFHRVRRFSSNLLESIVMLLCTVAEGTAVPTNLSSDESSVCVYVPQFHNDVRELLCLAVMRQFEGDSSGEGPKGTLRSPADFRCEEVSGDFLCSSSSREIMFPTHESLAELRATATAAASVVKQQMVHHRSLPISTSLLCRMFAAAVAGTSLPRTSPTLELLGEIARDEDLISPPMRYLLTLTVAEQSVLWDLVRRWRGRTDGEVEELSPAFIVHSVSRAFDAAQLHFVPQDSLILGEVLAPCNSSEGGGVCCHNGNTERCGGGGAAGVASCKEWWKETCGVRARISSCSSDGTPWEKCLQLFGAFLSNAHPSADLSFPFATLVELLSRCGQWSLACRYVIEAGAPGRRPRRHSPLTIVKSSEHDDAQLLSRHVVVDGFLLERLAGTVGSVRKRQQDRHVCEGVVSDIPLGFWRAALRILNEHHSFVSRSADTPKGNTQNGKCVVSLSPSILALMKKVHPR